MREVIKLTRWQEFVPFTLPLTLLGGLMAYRFSEDVMPDGRLLLVIFANCLAVAYAFMINDIEDAEDDARNPDRQSRNVIASGELSVRDGWVASLIVAGLSAIFYLAAGQWAFINGAVILVLAHLYSWKPIRLKALPVLDIVSHVLMLSTLLLLSAYMIYDPSPREVWLLVISVTLISAYGQLYNQLRDYEDDRAAGLRNTAVLLGRESTRWLSYLLVGGALVCLLLTIYQGAFPLWLGGVLVVTLPLVRLAASGKDMRGDETLDLLGDSQFQFLLAANIVLIVWLIYVLVNS